MKYYAAFLLFSSCSGPAAPAYQRVVLLNGGGVCCEPVTVAPGSWDLKCTNGEKTFRIYSASTFVATGEPCGMQIPTERQ